MKSVTSLDWKLILTTVLRRRLQFSVILSRLRLWLLRLSMLVKRLIGLRSATHQQPQNDALKPTLRRARGQSGRMTASKILALSRAHSSAILTLAAALDSNSVDFSDELLTDTGEGKLIPTPINISKRIEVA
jgi:hypothetical protein